MLLYLVSPVAVTGVCEQSSVAGMFPYGTTNPVQDIWVTKE